MALSRVIAGAALAFTTAAVSVAFNVSPAGARAASPAISPGMSASAIEVNRIHAHFDRVLRELEATDVTSLSRDQQESRAALIAMLRGYNARGIFPHNYDFPDAPTPYFVDRRTGTLCAVAFLLESTGRRDIVDRVARANNNVWVAQLAGDTAMSTWLDVHGITLAEAARIQVPYMAAQSTAQKARNIAFLALTPLSVIGSVVTTPWNAVGNADGHHRFVSIAGLVSGVVTAGMSTMLVVKPDMNQPARGLGVVGMTLGAMSIGFSTHAIHRHSRLARADRRTTLDAESPRSSGDVSIAPLLPLTKNEGAGLAVSLRF